MILPDIRYKNRFVICGFRNNIDNFAHVKRTFCRMYFAGYYFFLFYLLELLETFAPSLMISRLQEFYYLGKRFLAIAKHRNINSNILVYLRRVYVKMNFLCATGIST